MRPDIDGGKGVLVLLAQQDPIPTLAVNQEISGKSLEWAKS